MNRLILITLLSAINILPEYGQLIDFESNRPPAYFIDSIFTSGVMGLDADNISSINLVKEDVRVNGRNYYGKVYISSKVPLQLVTLKQIQQEYAPEISSTAIFMINGEFVKCTVEDYKIDKNIILKVESFDSKEFAQFKNNKVKFSIVRIYTKTKENMENAKQFRIR